VDAQGAGQESEGGEPGAAAPDAAPPAPEAPKPDNDIIQWPDEGPAKKELWEIAPQHEWEKEERGYIFEERLEKATQMKDVGNEHFRAGEWDLALRRYKRALYHGHIDEMQMFDLGEKHKADVHAVEVPCKLNLAFCISRMHELGEPLDAGSLDQAEEAINEVIKIQPANGKAFFRRGQVALLQLDLPKAREALDTAQKLAGSGGGVREAKARLKELERDERKRDRAMFSGTLQKKSLHQEQEARQQKMDLYRGYVTTVGRVVFFPITFPVMQLWMLLCFLVRLLRRKEKAQ